MVRQLGPPMTVLCLRLNKEGQNSRFSRMSWTFNSVSKVAVKGVLAVYWGSQ